MRRLSLFRFDGRLVISGFAEGVSQETVVLCLRSWATWLDDRGKIEIGCGGSDNYVELRKRCWKTKPDILFFRYRNADSTREHFSKAREILDRAGIDYSLTLTPQKKAPRAIEIALDPLDPLAPRKALNLAFLVFERRCERLDICCEGRVREDLLDPPVDFVIPPEIARQLPGWELGKWVGRAVGALKRLVDPRGRQP